MLVLNCSVLFELLIKNFSNEDNDLILKRLYNRKIEQRKPAHKPDATFPSHAVNMDVCFGNRFRDLTDKEGIVNGDSVGKICKECAVKCNM